MGVDFTLYQVKDDDSGDLCEIKEVLYFSNARADIVANWFYNNHIEQVKYDESKLYVETYGDYLVDLSNHLEQVLSKTGLERDLYAVFFLPPKCKVKNWCRGSDMFSESYYGNLEYIHEDVKRIIASDDFSYIEIILLPDIQSGKFEEYNSLDNTIVVDGKLYGLKKLNAEFTLGNTYMIRVNENNEIFYIENI